MNREININKCNSYSEDVGCYRTFDGSCEKEFCQTYRLLKVLEKIEELCDEIVMVNDTDCELPVEIRKVIKESSEKHYEF